VFYTIEPYLYCRHLHFSKGHGALGFISVLPPKAEGGVFDASLAGVGLFIADELTDGRGSLL
jgi:hypothetical protein